MSAKTPKCGKSSIVRSTKSILSTIVGYLANIIYTRLDHKRVNAKWVPNILFEAQKQARVTWMLRQLEIFDWQKLKRGSTMNRIWHQNIPLIHQIWHRGILHFPEYEKWASYNTIREYRRPEKQNNGPIWVKTYRLVFSCIGYG